MNISIVGLGHIGGSFSLGIKSVSGEHHFIGYDINENHRNLSLSLGLTDELAEYGDAIKKADLLVLATPVNIITSQLPEALDLLREDAVIIDLGSTKGNFCQIADGHPKRGRYVACHPMAGTENSGPEAAFSGLFKHKMMIICDKEKSDADAVALVEKLFQQLEMRLSYMDSRSHDLHIAYVSHLSHISSFALGLTVLEKEKNEKNIFNMAGSGFSSTVRLAKSSPAMWAPIFQQNNKNVLEALNAYIDQLKGFKALIENNNSEESYQLMEKANDIRRVLFGIDGK